MESNILSDLIITNIVSATTIYTDKGAKAKRHNRPVWALSLKYEGETEYTCGGSRIISNANEIILLPRGSDYEWTCTKPGHCTIIDFECNRDEKEIYSFRASDAEKILRKFRETEYRITLRLPMYLQESLRCLYDIILSLSAERAASYVPTSKASKIQPAIDYIAKNYAQKITNDFLASLCGLSTVYFRKLFKQAYGISPQKYIIDLRMQNAAGLIATGYYSLKEVAAMSGYQDYRYFSVEFKRLYGVSPSAYSYNYDQ